MERRYYYIHYYDETHPMAYRLYYLVHPRERIYLPDGARKVSGKNAVQLVSQERMRRRRNRPGAGLSDNAFFPATYENAREKIFYDPHYELDDWIWVRIDKTEISEY